MRTALIAGTRPNFVKIAPLLRELRRHDPRGALLVHTGQHYDQALSDRFFEDLDIPPPDVNLAVGSGSQAAQTAEVMRRLEPVLAAERPDVVVVVGDVNSTVAAALTTVKLGIPVAHVEAGLRSFDRTMPEEINRLVTDAIADELFVTETSGLMNLLREGVPPEKVHFVGNVMIDALEAARPRWERSGVTTRLGIEPGRSFALLTLHRPSNVDDGGSLSRILGALEAIARHLPIVFPVHPRVRPRLPRRLPWRPAGAAEPLPRRGIVCVEPLGYLDCIALISRARLALTDSGGIQEETTYLGVPCVTLRDNTERPVTITHGTNILAGTDPARIVAETLRVLERPPRPSAPPPLWDGRSSTRIVKRLLERQEAPAPAEAAA